LERHLTNVADDGERSDAYCGCLLLIAFTASTKSMVSEGLQYKIMQGLTCLRYMTTQLLTHILFHSNAMPASLILAVASSLILIHLRVLAVVPCVIHTLRRIVVNKLCRPHYLGRLLVLHPLHDSRQYVVICGVTRISTIKLPKRIGARAANTVTQTTDSEIPVKIVELLWRGIEGLGDVRIVSV
jgi:hypothetical protein